MLVLVLAAAAAWAVEAAEYDDDDHAAEDAGVTPPRLSLAEGRVAVRRDAEADWSAARINLPLAPGDRIAAEADGVYELEVGPNDFIRGWNGSRAALESHAPARMRLSAWQGEIALDLHTTGPDEIFEVQTPAGDFTIGRPGYYRFRVIEDRTELTVRRGGQARVATLSGDAFTVGSEQQAVVEDPDSRRFDLRAAPPRDRWDDWNFERSAYLHGAESARNVPRGVYGTRDLDRYGDWESRQDYGPVWVPRRLPPGWVPYSDGVWVADPYYGWTWVDAAPWGWAPFHYGRWVYVGSRWCWAPGPLVARPVYAPALVAFYGAGPAVSFSVWGPSRVGWVALGWGEPCVPWWGRPGFIHRPWWGGWGGPRIVNHMPVHRRAVVRAEDIHAYSHAGRRGGIVSAPADHFRRGRVSAERFSRADAGGFRPMHTALPSGTRRDDGRAAERPELGRERPGPDGRHPGATPSGGGRASLEERRRGGGPEGPGRQDDRRIQPFRPGSPAEENRAPLHEERRAGNRREEERGRDAPNRRRIQPVQPPAAAAERTDAESREGFRRRSGEALERRIQPIRPAPSPEDQGLSAGERGASDRRMPRQPEGRVIPEQGPGRRPAPGEAASAPAASRPRFETPQPAAPRMPGSSPVRPMGPMNRFERPPRMDGAGSAPPRFAPERPQRRPEMSAGQASIPIRPQRQLERQPSGGGAAGDGFRRASIWRPPGRTP
jgi:hypothetical protein